MKSQNRNSEFGIFLLLINDKTRYNHLSGISTRCYIQGDLFMKVCISAESTIDLSKELLKEFDIHTIPFGILLGTEAKLDGEIDGPTIFDYVDRTGVLPKTSAVNEFQYEEYFTELLKEYYAIVHFSLSSGISSSCSNAMNVAANMKNVYVVDSQSLSTGIALEAIYASKLAKEGKSAEEIVKAVEKRIPYNQTSFVLATVEYLHKGGRCSSLAKLGAQLFRIRPQILVSNGKMGPGKKYMGKQLNCVESYCKDTLEQFNNPDLSLVFITHSHATPDMVEAARKLLEKRGFKRIEETFAGGTISSHCGPKCLGILYFNDGEQK